MAGDFGNIRNEGGVAFNSGKKPVKLMRRYIEYFERNDITILDFFGGSGSTAHAVMSANADDNGTRKFIICTNNQNNICEDITYTRLKNVIEGYGQYKGIPTNLKYYKTEFIPKVSKNNDFYSVGESLLTHIKEMVQLEKGVSLDDESYILVLTDEDADKLEQTPERIKKAKGIYISSSVLLTKSQISLFSQVNMTTIPDYYFESELKEVGEL